MRNAVRRRVLPLIAATVAISALMIAGCGGGNNNSGPNPNTVGLVSGQVLDLSGNALGGVVVTIGTQQAISAPGLGTFTVKNILPGTYDIAISSAGMKLLVSLPKVVVVAGMTTPLPAPIRLVPSTTDTVPDPPGQLQ